MKTALPVTVNHAIELIGLFVLGWVIVAAETIVMPLLMAFFFSLLLLPLFRLFRKGRLPEAVAVFLPILLFTIFVALIIWLFSNQVGALLDDFPKIQHTVTKHLDDLSIWISRSFGYSPKEQVHFIDVQSKKLFNSLDGLISTAIGSVSGMIIFLGLLPIYIYLIMLYRKLFIKFLLMWFNEAQHTMVWETIREAERMVKNYLIGLLIQITYIIILLGGLLWVFGIQNALLIGIIFAFLNLIPYLGALIGNILGALLTLASSDQLADVLIVLGAITVVQFLDNNVLMPRIVGSQVKLNPLVSIVGIIAGGAMAGLSGMFLAMPVLAILKLIFDRSDHYRQWGVLLGDDPVGGMH